MKDEKQIELSFIKKLEELKYVYREDIKDKWVYKFPALFHAALYCQQ